MEGPDDQIWRIVRSRSREARSGKTFYAKSVPRAVRSPAQAAERDALRAKSLDLSWRDAVPLLLQIGRDLPRQHLDKARPEHADGLARVRNRLKIRWTPQLIHLAFGKDSVQLIECGKVEALPQD